MPTRIKPANESTIDEYDLSFIMVKSFYFTFLFSFLWIAAFPKLKIDVDEIHSAENY
jgi:hypothetical protein